jgi:hypothetical protein
MHDACGANDAAVMVLHRCAAAGGALGSVKLSRDQRQLAYSLEVVEQQQAAEQHCCIIRDIHAGEPETPFAHVLHAPSLRQ